MSADSAAKMAGFMANHIATSMLHGDYPERDRAYSAAHDVDRTVGGFIDLVKSRIQDLGGDPWVWTQPVAPVVDEPEAPTTGWGAPKPAVHMDALLSALTRHIAGAYISGSDDQCRRARELETGLDQAGLNVDNQVDRLVLNEMRLPPSTRGAAGRLDDPPF